MTDDLCVICRKRPGFGGYGCVPCSVTEPQRLLAEIGDMAGPALDIAQRQTSGGSSGGGGKPGSTVPIDLGAMARYDAVRSELTTWARHVAEERGVRLSDLAAGGLTALSRSQVWVDRLQAVTDDLSGIAGWLAEHCEWLRHRPEVDEFVADVRRCHRVLAGLARRGSGSREYLGPCGAELVREGCAVRSGIVACELKASGADECGATCAAVERLTCDGHVWANHGSAAGRCGTCRGQVDVTEREKWRDSEIRKHARRAAEIAGLFGINVNTIRSWAFGRPEKRTESGVVIRKGRPPTLYAHGHDAAGRPLYLVGDVLRLAAETAARRTVLGDADQRVQ